MSTSPRLLVILASLALTFVFTTAFASEAFVPEGELDEIQVADDTPQQDEKSAKEKETKALKHLKAAEKEVATSKHSHKAAMANEKKSKAAHQSQSGKEVSQKAACKVAKQKLKTIGGSEQNAKTDQQKAIVSAKMICDREKAHKLASKEAKQKAAKSGPTFNFKSGKPCSGGKGSFTKKLLLNEKVVVGHIPAQQYNVKIQLRTSSDVDTELWEKKREVAIVAWRWGKINSATQASVKYAGSTVKYSGYMGIKSKNGAYNFGHEDIEIAGKATVPFTMKAFAFEAGTARITYSWGVDPAVCAAAKKKAREEKKAKHDAKQALKRKQSEGAYKQALKVVAGGTKNCNGAKKWRQDTKARSKALTGAHEASTAKEKSEKAKCAAAAKGLATATAHKNASNKALSESAAKAKVKAGAATAARARSKAAAKNQREAQERLVKEKANKEKRKKEKHSKETSAKAENAAKEKAAKKKERTGKERAAKEKAAKENNKKARAKENAAKEKNKKEKDSKERSTKHEQAQKEKNAKAQERRDKERRKERAAKAQEKRSKELTTKERSSKERTSKERTGKERTSKERTSKERTSKERTSKERTSKERTSKERSTKNERSGKERSAKAYKARNTCTVWAYKHNNFGGGVLRTHTFCGTGRRDIRFGRFSGRRRGYEASSFKLSSGCRQVQLWDEDSCRFNYGDNVNIRSSVSSVKWDLNDDICGISIWSTAGKSC